MREDPTIDDLSSSTAEPLTRSEVLPPGLPTDTAMNVFLAGRTALSEVPGLNLLMVKGFVVMYAVSGVLAVIGVAGIYTYLVQPAAEFLTYWSTGDNAWLTLIASLLKALLWLGQFALLVVTLLFSFRVALSLMGAWFEVVAEHIVRHCQIKRGEHPPPAPLLPWRVWWDSLGRNLHAAAISLVGSILAIFLGFVPFIGPILALGINAYLLGRDAREPYLNVLASHGAPYNALRKGLRRFTFRLGLMPVLVGLVPFVGWLALPVVMLYLVAGVAWLGEQKRLPVSPSS